jgi:hypothetical protein
MLWWSERLHQSYFKTKVVMSWELRVIKARHKCMVDLHLAGMTNVQIAEEMDCTPESVGMILRSPIVQQEIAQRRGSITKHTDEAYTESLAKVREIMGKASPQAARTFVNQLDHEDPRVAANAAKNVLEHVFGDTKDGKPKVVIQIQTEQLQLLQQTLMEVSGA